MQEGAGKPQQSGRAPQQPIDSVPSNIQTAATPIRKGLTVATFGISLPPGYRAATAWGGALPSCSAATSATRRNDTGRPKHVPG
jgi:hypothetical protein